MSPVTYLKHLRKLATTPDGVQCLVVWMRPVIPSENLYECSLERLDGGYTMWFVDLTNGFEWVCCSLEASARTLAIKFAEKALEEQCRNVKN